MTTIEAWVRVMSDWFTVLLSWLGRRRAYVVNLTKRPVPAVWIEPDEEWGAVLEEVKIDMSAAVGLTKSIETQHRRRVHRAMRDEARAAQERMIHDELGSWDPDAVDWQEPAIYIDLGRQVFATGLRSFAVSS